MCLVVCEQCGNKVKIEYGNILGEVICSKCNSYLGEIFEITDEDDFQAPIEKIFVISLINENEDRARGTIPRFEASRVN
jgi:hypothetical protein